MFHLNYTSNAIRMYSHPYQENTTRFRKFKIIWYIYKKIGFFYKEDREQIKTNTWGSSSNGRAHALHAWGKGIDAPVLQTFFFAFLYALVKFYASWSVRCANFYVNWVSRTGEMFQRERFWIIFFFFPCLLEEYHGSWCSLACSFTSLTER